MSKEVGTKVAFSIQANRRICFFFGADKQLCDKGEIILVLINESYKLKNIFLL